MTLDAAAQGSFQSEPFSEVRSVLQAPAACQFRGGIVILQDALVG